MMTSTLLRDIGECLYGARWQSELARDLDVSDRTMRRWLSHGHVPDGVPHDARKLCHRRVKELVALIERLP